jgi:hypothetical protein
MTVFSMVYLIMLGILLGLPLLAVIGFVEHAERKDAAKSALLAVESLPVAQRRVG